MYPLPARLFNSVANLFYSPRLLREIESRLDPQPGDIVLDIPCGTGTLRHLCSPETTNYLGVDIDGDRINDAKLKFNDPSSFQVGSVTNLDFENHYFDVILVSGLFHHLSDHDTDKALTELSRILKPTGKIVVLDAIWPRNPINLIGWFGRYLDQGRFVRTAEQFESMFRNNFNLNQSVCLRQFGLEYILVTLTPHLCHDSEDI